MHPVACRDGTAWSDTTWQDGQPGDRESRGGWNEHPFCYSHIDMSPRTTIWATRVAAVDGAPGSLEVDAQRSEGQLTNWREQFSSPGFGARRLAIMLPSRGPDPWKLDRMFAAEEHSKLRAPFAVLDTFLLVRHALFGRAPHALVCIGLFAGDPQMLADVLLAKHHVPTVTFDPDCRTPLGANREVMYETIQIREIAADSSGYRLVADRYSPGGSRSFRDWREVFRVIPDGTRSLTIDKTEFVGYD